jgi:hypothetical protein
MNRTVFWAGIGLLMLGAATFLVFVLPSIGDATSDARFDTWLDRAPTMLAVAVASLGLAGGAALVGIGLGKWKRPKASPYDGSPEV